MEVGHRVDKIYTDYPWKLRGRSIEHATSRAFLSCFQVLHHYLSTLSEIILCKDIFISCTQNSGVLVCLPLFFVRSLAVTEVQHHMSWRDVRLIFTRPDF